MLREMLAVAVCLIGATGTAFGAGLTLAADGKTAYTIVVDPDATLAEEHAAAELAAFLEQVTGAQFPIRHSVATRSTPMIVVGPGRIAQRALPTLDIDGLKPDGIVIQTCGRHLVLAGPRPRGTLYAVYTFLEDVVGCRWWSSKVSSIPQQATLTIPPQHVRYVPPLEYRETFWLDAFDGDWAARNKSNGSRPVLDEKRGGKITYGSYFVHTFERILPTEKYFAEHPEWYSERNGERIDGRNQLCVTNEEVKQRITDHVLEYLRAHPTVNIVSVSQNDWDNHCLCESCKKLEDEEGSPAGPLLHLVNHVAAAVAKEFPDVAIDTLAYQYTRKPPLHVRPLPNVIVRLCSIECDFARPLTAETNQTFADDIRGWSKICDRLYIWDYTTNFSHYIQPHPNLRALGPNIRFFVEHGVKGIFEQGAYTSLGAEFAELKAWVLAHLLWNPDLDDAALVEEFVRGYYGPAAPHISEYIKLIYDEAEATDTYLGCFSSMHAPFLNLTMLGRAHELLNRAEAAVASDPDLLHRVKVAHLPVLYVFSMRWPELEVAAARADTTWPGPADAIETARGFIEVARQAGVTKISEGGPLENFERRTIGLGRITSPPPAGCENLGLLDWFDFQDHGFSLYREGTYAVLEHDEAASDKVAVRMPGDHHEWAVQQRLIGKPWDAEAEYAVYASIRAEKTGDVGGAFTAGIYDAKNKVSLGQIGIACEAIADGEYHTYTLGTTKLHGEAYFWAAPAKNPENVNNVWVDRFWAVRVR